MRALELNPGGFYELVVCARLGNERPQGLVPQSHSYSYLFCVACCISSSISASASRSYVLLGHDLRAVGRMSNDFATSRAHARKRSTTGLSVRFFKVAITTGHG
jgi:hypothetical protein